MADLQVKGSKIVLIDSGDNVVYELPDSSGSAGQALISNGTGKINYGGISIDAVLAAGNTSDRRASVTTANIKVLKYGRGLGIPLPASGSQSTPTSHGYVSGGAVSILTSRDTIEKFNLDVGETNATDIADLTVSRWATSGQSSSTHGYTTGGTTSPTDPYTLYDIIDKFPFSSDANASDVGNLTQGFQNGAGHQSSTHGYISGYGSTGVQKYPFASDANATEASRYTNGFNQSAGQSSSTHGYNSGGAYPSNVPPAANLEEDRIDKFPFANNSAASLVGDLSLARKICVGIESDTAGLTCGGSKSYAPPSSLPFTGGLINRVDKFPFATDANATDLSNLSTHCSQQAGISGSNEGFVCGGQTNSGPSAPLSSKSNLIQRVSYVNSGLAIEIGDLTVAKATAAGQEV